MFSIKCAVSLVLGVSGMVLASGSASPRASLSLSIEWRRKRPMNLMAFSPTPSLFLTGMTRTTHRTNSVLKVSSSNSAAADCLALVGS